MPGSIITISLGGCGNSVGAAYWKQIAQEHSIHCSGIYNGDANHETELLDVCFIENVGCQFIPRSLFIDTQPAIIDNIRSSSYGDLYHGDFSIFTGTEKNMDTAHNMQRYKEAKRIKVALHKQLEHCTRIEGFQVFHSVAGGCGSGFTAAMIDNIKDDVGKSQIQSITHFPMEGNSSSKSKKAKQQELINPNIYSNVIDGINPLLDLVDQIVAFDNVQIEKMIHTNLNLPYPALMDINALVGSALSAMTASFRFKDLDVNTMTKLFNNLIPRSQFKIATLAFAPAVSAVSNAHTHMEENTLAHNVLNHDNFVVSTDVGEFEHAQIIRAYCLFRGLVNKPKCHEVIEEYHKNNSFLGWCPSPILAQYHEIPMKNGPAKCAGMIVNGKMISHLLSKVLEYGAEAQSDSTSNISSIKAAYEEIV